METWKAVPGYEGAYEVSDLGRVRSLDRVTAHTFIGPHTRRGKILTLNPISRGHLVVRLFKEGRVKSVLVHRLVLEAFVGPAPAGLQGLHRDDIPAHNVLPNLYWGTPGDNARNGKNYNARKTMCKYGHPLAGENLRILATPTGTARRCRECERRNAREAKRARSHI